MKTVTFHLEQFEGPLDLLLSLIQKSKINIYDIPISLLLEQYMEYIKQMREFDLEVAAEFVAMAAQLMYIKSKMLLPVYEEEAGQDPRADLVEALLEYQRFQQIGGYLRSRSDLGRDLFVKPQERIEKSKTVVYCYEADVLARAISEILERSERRLPPPVTAFSGIIGREPVPVSDKIAALIRMFVRQNTVNFEQAVLSCTGRSEVIALFLAVLELSKTRKICIEDSEHGYQLTLVGE